MSEQEITIRLTFAEAAVLDELLRRYSSSDHFTIEDQAEQQALYNLACLLERDGDRPNWPSLENALAELRRSDA